MYGAGIGAFGSKIHTADINRLVTWGAILIIYYAGTADDRLNVIGYVKNITEEEIFTNSTAHSNVYQLVGLEAGNPRTYGVLVRYNF